MGPAIAIYTSPSLLMLVPVLLGVTFAISQVTPGDPGFNSAIAGHFGVPVALVCGDDTVDRDGRVAALDRAGSRQVGAQSPSVPSEWLT